MDSPRREQCAHASELQGSPIFKFLCSLSPIKQAKSVHVAQTYSELSFPAPPAVFASPPAKVPASKRDDFQGKSDSTAAHDDYDSHISTSPSENGIREEGAASDLTCSPGELRTWRSKNLRSSRRPSGCGAAFLTCRSTQVAAIESHCLSAEDDLQTTSNLPVQELERSPDEQEISENPIVEDTSEKPPALSFFLSGEVEEMSSFSEDSASLGATNEDLPGCEDIANSHASEMEPLPISSTNDLASKEVIHQDEEEKSSRMTKVNQRGARRRCLDFDDSQTLQAASTENTLHSGMPLSLVSPGSTIPSSMLSDSALDTTIASTSCTQSYVTSTMSLMSNSASSARFSDLGTLPSDTCKTTQLIRDAIPSGIGLHLNSLTNSLGMLAAPRGTSLQSLVSSSQEMQSEGFGKCKLTVSSGRGNMPGSALNLRPGLLVSVVEKTRMDQQELQGSAGSQGALVKSTTCVRSLTLGIQALEECLPFEIEKVVTPGRKRLSLQQDSMEGETSRTPKKKRKSLTSAEKGDGCKRCHCKKSKCLKLYCECFAAGVYCLDSCACRDCFNKPEYAETVIGTRQQIETRNPLAFAPKIVQASDSTPAEGVKCPDTTTSARHKRGCNCKKSLCLKKYCECYQAGVGCSEGCRCNGCKNIYGVKKDPEEVDQLEDQSGDLLKSKNTIASISPITPTFQHTPGLDMPPDSSGFSKSIFGSGACAFGAESTRLFPSSTPDVSLEQPSPRWEVLDDICTITPLPQHPLRPPTPSTMVKSDVSPFSSQPGQSPMSAYPVSSDGCSFLPCDSANTPTPCPSSPFSTSVSKFIDSNHLLSDETPEFLRDDHSPRTMMKGSPKQKRVVPPNTQGMLSGSSSVLRSGRKLTLQALPSLPPVTPFSFTQGQGYRRS